MWLSLYRNFRKTAHSTTLSLRLPTIWTSQRQYGSSNLRQQILQQQEDTKTLKDLLDKNNRSGQDGSYSNRYDIEELARNIENRFKNMILTIEKKECSKRISKKSR